MSNITALAQKPHGVVVAYTLNERSGRSYEQITRAGSAKRLLALSGFVFDGEYHGSVSYSGLRSSSRS